MYQNFESVTDCYHMQSAAFVRSHMKCLWIMLTISSLQVIVMCSVLLLLTSSNICVIMRFSCSFQQLIILIDIVFLYRKKNCVRKGESMPIWMKNCMFWLNVLLSQQKDMPGFHMQSLKLKNTWTRYVMTHEAIAILIILSVD